MKRLAIATLALCACAPLYAQTQTQITIATVNNPQMVVMKSLTSYFEKAHPNIKVNWDVMPENELRQKVTLDISQKAGNYDIVTLGAYSTPIWAKNGWIAPLNNLPKSYDLKDVMQPIRQALSYNGELYALPFYAESSFTYYRKDLFKKAGLTMPERPTWKQVEQFAKKLNDPANNVNGICLRGMPGWGENMALFDTMVNTYGGRWFNMKWQPQLTTPAWHDALNMYINLLTKYGPSGATSNGFVENENLFSNGHCAMWVDATSGAGYISDPKTSKVAKDVAFTQAPVAKTVHGSHWFWAWALAIPKDTQKMQAARTFIEWATSQQYIDLVGKTQSWVNVPPGTRYSTYANPKYKAAAPYAGIVLKAINQADPNHPTLEPVPYTGVQFVSIPQFQALGTQVGQNVAAALAGQMSVDQALKQSQTYVTNVMKQSGYLK
jgi:sorbitol/mannitol transport system substrate-binding protein